MKKLISAPLNYLLFFILLLISFLPFWVHYLFSFFLYLVLYYLLGYRKRVVVKNLESSFDGNIDIKRTSRKFYRFLSDTFVESVKLMTIRKKNLLRRVVCENPEIMEKYAAQNRSVVFMSAHYGNWEMLIYALNLLFPHLAVGVGKPLTNQVLNVLINNKRSRFGMKIISASNIKEEFEKDKNRLTASLFLADQYPGGAKKGFPALFLKKETYFMYGAEKYAKAYNFPVVYADVYRVKRGFYRLRLIEIDKNSAESQYGFIMQNYIKLLSDTINREPQYWLWSHKRWKNIENFYSL